ncbi:MAG: hcnA [Firmicutes bacterium]|nr:hcnA [Bacillota bacterium]
MRITSHPILNFTEKKLVQFNFNGQQLEGYAGEPIAAALHAAGITVLRHSHELNRPRGLFCAIGNCSSCLMVVDGMPNVRVCVEPLQDGMIVETQIGRGKLP